MSIDDRDQNTNDSLMILRVSLWIMNKFSIGMDFKIQDHHIGQNQIILLIFLLMVTQVISMIRFKYDS